MKKILKALVSAVLAAAVLAPAVYADDVSRLKESMTVAYNKATSYESGDNFAFAGMESKKYISFAEKLTEMGELSEKELALARSWREQLTFAPELYIGNETKDGVFFGGDGVYAEGSSAVKLKVPYGADVSGFYSMIPATNKEVCVLVSLEPTNEKILRNIAFGNQDEYLIRSLRQISRIEGRVYLSFCPSVNMWKKTRTVEGSFIQAFRYVSDMAKRYAPNVQMVYSLGDVRSAGENTVGDFYPGDGYADVFGVELVHTYNKSYMPSLTAAYDSRADYYDPVLSVARMVTDAEAVFGSEMPVMITGCSFPWEGKAALGDWDSEMERFYNLIPAVCPSLVGVFYSNQSSSNGICNLRQNKTAFELYKKCLEMPWYIDLREDDRNMHPVSIVDKGVVPVGVPVPLVMYQHGRLSDIGYRVFLDGNEIVGKKIAFAKGIHTLEVYFNDYRYSGVLGYTIDVAGDGKFTATAAEAAYDYDGSGILDIIDAEMLLLYVSKVTIDMGDGVLDVNGDGKVNLRDVAILRAKLEPSV